MFHSGRITGWWKVRSCLLSASKKSSYKAEITADCQGAAFHRLDSVRHWVTLQTDRTVLWPHSTQPAFKVFFSQATDPQHNWQGLDPELSLLWGIEAEKHCPQKSLSSNVPDFAKSRVSLLPAKPWPACSSTFTSTWLIPSFFRVALKWEGWQCCTACKALGKSSHTGKFCKRPDPSPIFLPIQLCNGMLNDRLVFGDWF